MKTQIIGVERNEFVDKNTGEVVSYASVTILEPLEKSADKYGYTATKYTTKYDNFDKLLNLYKNYKDVEVEFEFKQVGYSSNYKKKIKKINEIAL